MSKLPPPGLTLQREAEWHFDWTTFASGIGESAANLLLKGWADGGVSSLVTLVKAVTGISMETPVPARAWGLAVFSFAWSIDQLKNGNDDYEEALRSSLKDAISVAKEEVDNGNSRVDLSFLTRPSSLNLYIKMRDTFISNKSSLDDLSNLSDKALKRKLDVIFNRAVFEIWSRQSAQYKSIRDSLEAPGAWVSEREVDWLRYRNKIIYDYTAKPTFGQETSGISLSQLYTPLRAYSSSSEDEHVVVHPSGIPVNAKFIRLDDYLDEWVSADTEHGQFRLIGGGPGSGKSTTLRALASRMAENENIRPLFIPLQHIDLKNDLRESINSFFSARTNGAFRHAPLARDAIEDGVPLLLIFDGLDELAAPNQAANDMIANLAHKVINLVASLRGDGENDVKVVLSGRTASFQIAKKQFEMKDEHCLEVVGFSPIDNGQENPSEIELEDQRLRWWSNYSSAIGRSDGIPQALISEKLSSISNEPLLCYLLVLSGFAEANWEVAAENRNIIYRSLIVEIYRRGWGEGDRKRLGPGRTLSEIDFHKLMRTIGLASWMGGDTRVATEDAFKSALEITKAGKAWDNFQADNGPDITNLAMNFYLKASEKQYRGFEFTHKSFGEYLTAQALVDVIISVCPLVEHGLEFAMIAWSAATATGRMTDEILEFVKNEVQLRADVEPAFSNTLKSILDNTTQMAEMSFVKGFPVSRAESFRDCYLMQAQSEAALWSIISAVSETLNKRSEHHHRVDAGFLRGFGIHELLSKHIGINGPLQTVISNCLSNLEVPDIFFFGGLFENLRLSGIKCGSILIHGAYIGELDIRFSEIKSISLSSIMISDFQLNDGKIDYLIISQGKISKLGAESVQLDRAEIDVETIIVSGAGCYEPLADKLVVQRHKKDDFFSGVERNTAFADQMLGKVAVAETHE